MMPDPVFEIFREEAREHLSRLEQGFLDLEQAALPERAALINDLFRHAHSLKGDARAVGLPRLQQAAQVLENVLDDLRERPETVSRAVISTGLTQLDEVRTAFEAWQQGAEALAEEGNGRPASSAGETPPLPRTAPEPSPTEPKPPGPGEVRSLPAATAPVPEESFTVRVPTERLDRMLASAGELRIAQRAAADVGGRLSDLRTELERLVKGTDPVRPLPTGPRDERPIDGWQHSLDSLLDQVRRIETDLRNIGGRQALLADALETDIRGARLLPLVMLTDSLRRVIRDLAQSLGKSIRYEVDVGPILVDKAVIEALREPLLHLIRNACDHGLETPQERQAAGKPAEGTIRIHALRCGERIRMTIADDGRGINFERVRDRLRRRGGVREEDLRQRTDRELATYLFEPGFTTVEAGGISGRGVGLDVVRETIRRLQGEVELGSSSPAGASFVLTVPVSVSTVRVLTVFSHGHYYGIPTASIVRTGRAGPDDLRELQGRPVLPIDGRPVRWIPLAELLHVPLSPSPGNGRTWPYLLAAQQDQLAAVAVEDLEEESEVLLKPLGFPLAGLPGVVGGTIRPDGSVQVVLDLAAALLSPATVPPPPSARRRTSPRILVVDDSPTTRAILRNVFTAAGYVVRTATDGVDALERLRAGPADVVVTDVEMPRLNGFDLTRQIKARFGLPVILVTGREQEEHRREGLAAGADAYVVKSTFQGQGLLEVVEQFV